PAAKDARRETAYATASAIDFREPAPFGPFVDESGKPVPALDPQASREPYPIALTKWTADELQAKVGDEIELKYFPPEGSSAATKIAKFQVASIVALQDAADDRQLTPDFPGITDSLTIGDWDAPFDFRQDRVKPQDEDYWDKYKATPKAYVSLAVGRKLWGSRFGDISGVRIRPDLSSGATIEQAATAFAAKLQSALDPQAMGFVFQPVKAQQLAAASGSTPFDALFLGFSFFLIAAAVMLAGLLFRLNVESRAHEIGVLLACGLTLPQVRRLLATEGLCVALVGGAIGTALGVGYAWLMIFALKSPALWLAAVGVPFLELHVSPLSLILGLVIGVAVCSGAIWMGTWSLDRTPVRRLLAGRTDDEQTQIAPPARWTMWLGAALVLVAAGLVPFASGLNGMAQAGAFFGAGAALLAGMLIVLRGRLRGGQIGAVVGRTAPAFQFAMRNVARNPGRSVLTVGLVASATFLIVAMSAFHIDPSLIGPDKNSGNGGFSFVAESDQPVFVDLNDYDTPEGQEKLNISAEHAAALHGVKVFAFRVRPGDDASCLNLYQPRQPRVLGLPPAFLERGGFAWAGIVPTASEAAKKNPWLLLTETEAQDGGPTPIVLDMATAMYGLKVGLGSTLSLRGDDGTESPVRVVGLLDNSILQGDVLMSEQAFERRFPSRSGRRFFLIETPSAPGAESHTATAESVAKLYEQALGDQGFITETASARLARFLAVQNTYLVTFQSLGGLGLLLGAFGVAAVQLRNVLERRSELALMQAVGFRKGWLARMVFWETLVMLLGGMIVGTLAAGLAISPQLLSSAASIPWATLGILLGLVVVCGLVAGALAVRATLKIPVIQALRD
ncbi:MAG TPA: ABC transporter permease, partial [Pirellulales bacterium]